jgi:hypothetical protein
MHWMWAKPNAYASCAFRRHLGMCLYRYIPIGYTTGMSGGRCCGQAGSALRGSCTCPSMVEPPDAPDMLHVNLSHEAAVNDLPVWTNTEYLPTAQTQDRPTLLSIASLARTPFRTLETA